MKIEMIELDQGAKLSDIVSALARLGLWVSPLKDESGEVHALRVDPSSASVTHEELELIEGVSRVLGAPSPHPLVDRLAHRSLQIAGYTFGCVTPWSAHDSDLVTPPLLIAGPCSFESEAVVYEVARLVSEAGGRWLRGGAYKPRTSPYSFQGEGEKALRWARAAADRYHLSLVTEALSESEVDLVANYADVIQIGTRNMQNFALLKKVGQAAKPTLLKRGLCATIEEWLLAGEYLLKHGADSVVFCERGLRHYDQSTRNLLDLGAAALLKHQYGLPVIVDPSHAAGRRDLIAPLSRAAIAMGVDGVMIETHPDPGSAKSDAAQALSPEVLKSLSIELGILTAPSKEQASPSKAPSKVQVSETSLPFPPNIAELPSAERSLS